MCQYRIVLLFAPAKHDLSCYDRKSCEIVFIRREPG